jgi:hypothetical protein
VHSLPFKIKYDGPAAVDRFFQPATDDKHPGKTYAAFRGRKLWSQNVDLPEDLAVGMLVSNGAPGAVVQKKKETRRTRKEKIQQEQDEMNEKAKNNPATKEWNQTASFNRISFWEEDDPKGVREQTAADLLSILRVSHCVSFGCYDVVH